MSESAPASETIVPIKVPQPADHAPPTLAEPASGPAAEMHGALLKENGKDSTEPSTEANGAASTTEIEPDKPEETPAAAEPEKTTGEPSEKPSEEQAEVTNPDTEMKDAEPESAEAAETVASEPAPASNGTPASTKTKRKSVSGVPEHRNKSLKKKQSKAKLTNLDAKPGDYFLARLRSYPPWPSVICDEDMLPEALLNSRPVTAKQVDGNFKEPYADDGKKVTDRTFPIMFLSTNEFAWLPNTDLTPLDPEGCKNVSEKSKTKALIDAYKVASEANTSTLLS